MQNKSFVDLDKGHMSLMNIIMAIINLLLIIIIIIACVSKNTEHGL